MRNQFLTWGIVIVLASWGITFLINADLWIPILLSLIYLWGLYDAFQTKHAILRNFPVLGNFRYFFEEISPEMQQYFIERNTDGKPFPRNERSAAYRRAKNISANVPFGTQLDINTRKYEGIKHSIYAKVPSEELPRVTVGGPLCKKPYNASLFNISAMSYGALSNRAVVSLNSGAKKGNFFHNTGEGGISHYHLEGGGDLCWQIGTGYFGCRDDHGHFNPELFAEKSAHPNVKLIEIKLSQGAKPGHGGVLPGVKNTPEIAKIRHVEPGKTILSPPGHTAFNSAEGLLKFVQQLRDLSEGKPVGFKLCIGDTREFEEICEKMNVLNIWPDFITVDGAEGGTGAAPLEFSDGVGMPLEPALIFVNRTLQKYDVRDKIRIIASGKVLTSLDILRAVAMGADMCNNARGFMFSLGCIQALRCHSNACPTGVATQDKMLIKGLDVADKSERVYYFHRNTLHTCNELIAAAGRTSYAEVDASMFMRGDEFEHLSDSYFPDILTNVKHKTQI
ncbi:glutamate synthase [Elizabethkingia miricola]|uniref:Glutamate synthase n=2 Tax=Elizabethkingia TaxID=308865 RepID=A0AAQ1PL07_ELIMR|nr:MULTISPECIES: FMN-binding glutamate synthase family protein [Elizabethkingia]MCT3762815.1 FMN-binding glutamate synthase family protein [Elizabethkingia anophelis]KUG11050.1 glutamate synthase [Elizabethkingia miricola]KUY17737.1 glutamate synthase [Elizabethkingia miricola]MCL1652430.1 FMN-binding glutamate synthase family protein [Elizabethkingia miricola]MCL1656456.1 FMN-binding glutamate synthase family protein [Elizabethkingia miricola]